MICFPAGGRFHSVIDGWIPAVNRQEAIFVHQHDVQHPLKTLYA